MSWMPSFQAVIADLAVTTAKIAAGAITAAKLAAGAVTGSKLDLAAVKVTCCFPGSGAGTITCPMALPGQRIASVLILDTGGATSSDGTANFTSPVAGTGQIAQTGGSYAGKLAIIVLVDPT